MIIILKPETTHEDAKQLVKLIEDHGVKPLLMPGIERLVIGAIGEESALKRLSTLPSTLIEAIKPVTTPYKLVSREFHAHDTLVNINEHFTIGSEVFSVIAGPRTVENATQIEDIATMVKESGASGLSGGTFKPGSSPYSFQGLGYEGLKLMRAAADKSGLAMISEVIDTRDVESISEYVDMFQIDARNMQNYALLKSVGQTQKPVLLKRGLSASIEEFLLAAEYIYNEGNENIVLCEQGIQTIENAARNTLDLNAVAYIKTKSHLPVIVDPSYGTTIRELVTPLAKAAIACGADGLMLETHLKLNESVSDEYQSLTANQFKRLMLELEPFISAAGKRL
ncbi:MAG: 3-deoxy-7-phosphoheptulonate synthase [Pseudomonadota bacterium]